MITTSTPFHMNTTAFENQNLFGPKETMLDPSQGQMHGPTTTEQVSDTQRRRSSAYSENEHFTVLSDPVEPAPPVIVFFSFMSSRSKSWAVDHQIVDNIRRNVPQGTSIVRYHAPMQFAWEFGDVLTHSWAVAESLHVDDRIIGPMCKAVQGKQVTDLEGVRTVFDSIGIPPDMLLGEWAKPWVVGEKEAMDKAVAHVDLKDVPGILVKGKYMVKLESFGDAFDADQAVDLVKDLLSRP